MKTFLYKILYSPELNPFFRFIAGLTSAKGKFPPSGRLKFRVNQTAFRLHTNQSNYLTKLAYWNGAAQFEYSSEFERLCKKCSMFMDIGANIGYFTVIAGKSNPQMKIAAFEPARGPLHYLKRNVALNELDSSVMVESMALSNKQGKITFNDVRNPKYRYLKYNLAGEGNIGVEVKNRDILQYEVDTVTLDAYVSLHGIKPDLIKIDTEGTEHIILKHGLETIRNARPIIISEILFHRIEKDLDDLFLPEGYVFFYHTEKGLVKTDRLERTSDNGVRNAFLVPEEKLPLIQEFLA